MLKMYSVKKNTGASGGFGTFAMQIAKAFGAGVTAVCNTQNVDIARSIGTDHVIYYTRENFVKKGQRYDLILAINGYHSIFDYWRALSPGGIYISAGGSLAQVIEGILLGRLLSRLSGKKFEFMGIATTDQKDLVILRDLLETGKVVPVIDRSYVFREVPEALQYLGEGHAKGKIVITVK
jgi:NADPH:quinone reductase-like Zn-dependent oxidoreductase